MQKYGDLIKDASDLLSKKYKFDKKVKITTKSADGVKFTSEGKLKSKGFDATVKAEFAKDSFKVDKIELASAGTLVAEFKLAGLTDGLDLTFKAHESLRTAGTLSYGKLGATYKADSLRVDTEVDLINGPTVDASAVFGYQNVSVGATATFNAGAKENQLSGYGVGLAYAGAGFSVGARTLNKFGNVEAGLIHAVNSNTKVAATAAFALPSGKGETAPWTVAVGGSHGAVQAKIDTSGKVSANYETKLNSCATLTFAAAVDATNLGSDKHSLGFGLAFSA